MVDEAKTIRWHQGFRGGIEALLWPYRNDLVFGEEFPLSKEALRVDLLVLKKTADVVVDNEIGRLFRMYNILEYKSPEDSLTIDDYYKTVAYACLYKALGKTVDEIPGRELTASIFRHSYPRELFRSLEDLGAVVEQKYNGVYYVSGLAPFPAQIVVSGQLDPGVYATLRAMSLEALYQDAHDLILQSKENPDPEFRRNMDAVLQVSVAANRELYERIRRDSAMCEALRDLMKDEFDAYGKQERNAGMQAGMQAGMEKGMNAGVQKGRQEVALRMIQRRVSADVIMDMTELPLNKLQELAVSLNIPLAVPEKS